MKKIIGIFIASYVILLIISITGIFAKWTSPLYYLGPLTMFFLTYFALEYLQKEIKFNFAEPYVGLLFLIIMYLGYWLAFRIYYGNYAALNNMPYSEFYLRANLNMFKYMINSPIIYLMLSAFFGWIGFYIEKIKK